MRLSENDMKEIFVKMGWNLETNQGRKIFELLHQASLFCQPNSITLDVSAGQCRYKPFFSHSQYFAIDSCTGDTSWDFSKLDLMGDAFQLPVVSESVDTCLNFTCLEHYHNPNQAFHEFSRILKPGGRLFLYVPCCIAEHQIPHDYYRYTRYALLKLCLDNGLKIGYIKPSNGIFETSMGLLGCAISNIQNPTLKEKMTQVHETLKPIFYALDREEGVIVDFPMFNNISQFPEAYCLQAYKPGELKLSEQPEPQDQILKRIAACPSCLVSLDWQDDHITCPQCKNEYPILNNIPNLMPLSDFSVKKFA